MARRDVPDDALFQPLRATDRQVAFLEGVREDEHPAQFGGIHGVGDRISWPTSRSGSISAYDEWGQTIDRESLPLGGR